MAKIITKNSFASGTSPSGLSAGELAVNVVDKKLFVGNAVESAITLIDGNNIVTSINGTTGANYIVGGRGVTLIKSGNTYYPEIFYNAAGPTGLTFATITKVQTTDKILIQQAGAGTPMKLIEASKFINSPVFADVTTIPGPLGSYDFAFFDGIYEPYKASGTTVRSYLFGDGVVTSVNGATGAITNVAKTNIGQTFTIPTAQPNITFRRDNYFGSDSATIRFIAVDPTNTFEYKSDIRGNSNASGDTTHTLPATTGTLLNSNFNSYVSSYNGRTGDVQGVSAASAGAGISVSGTTGAVTITNTGVLSFNGSTGAVQGVASVNGCTGIIGITGTVNEIEVTGSCPNIVIGLPNDVTIAGTLKAQGLSAEGLTAYTASLSYVSDVLNISGSNGVVQVYSLEGQRILTNDAAGVPSYSTLNNQDIYLGDPEYTYSNKYIHIHNELSDGGGLVSVYSPSVFYEGVTFTGNIYAPNIITSVNGQTGAVAITYAAASTITSSNVNGTRYITFVGGTGNTGLFIDDVTTPLSYNPQQGNISAKKVTLTTGSNIVTVDSTGNTVTLTDGANISTFGLESFASSNSIPFELSAAVGLTLTSNSGGIAMSGAGYYYKFPESNGSSNQVLTTNGAGTLSWSTVSGGSSTGFTYASSAPGTPTVGDRWLDSDTGKEYVYVNDGSSSQWIEPTSSNGLAGLTYYAATKLYEFGGTGSFVKLGVNNTSPQYTLDVNGIINAPVGISAGPITSSGATFSGAVVSDGGFRITSSTINAQTGVTYTLLTSDNGKIITMDNGSSSTVTIPSGLPIGYNTTVIQLGTGQVGFTSSGTTINSSESKLNIATRYAAANIISYTSNTFILAGGLTG